MVISSEEKDGGRSVCKGEVERVVREKEENLEDVVFYKLI